MLVTITMLAVALVPTGDFWWLTNLFLIGELRRGERGDWQTNTTGVPAICYFQKLNSRNLHGPFITSLNQTRPMVISLAVLFFGYLTRLVRLSCRATAFTRLCLRTKPGVTSKKALKATQRRSKLPRASFYWIIQHMAIETIYINLCACCDIWESMFWEVRLSALISILQHKQFHVSSY